MNDQKIGNIKNNSNSVIGNGNSGVRINDCDELEKALAPVSYIVHEGDMARLERQNKRLFISSVISNITLLAVIIALIIFFSQYEFEEIELSSEGGGNANYIGEDGNIYNGSYQG